MSCDKERSALEEYSRTCRNPQFRREARELRIDLSGACGVNNSFRSHTARLLAGQTLEHAREVKQAWEKQKQKADKFIKRHRITLP